MEKLKDKRSLFMFLYGIVTVVSFYTVTELVGIDTSPAYQYSTYLKEIIIAIIPLLITISFPVIRKMFINSFVLSPLALKMTWVYITGFFLFQYLIMKITYDYGILISNSWRIFYNLEIPYITHFQYPVLGFSLYAIARVLIVPIIEEFFYRVFLITFFNKWVNIWVAVVLQMIIFSMNHPFSPFSAGVFGLLLGTLYVRTKSIIPGLILHSLWNLYSALIMNFDLWFIPRW
ncbi:MAG: CPBP family intramembrane glutamic endopeptidase [Halobacillus sp.]|uniref:CPBP family intramembrane glutamic endopeptidase n=1 Tax=Halobacillus sp. TaxID=56800 RepID=UPI003BAF5D85